MLKIIISGSSGHMGRAVAAAATDDPDVSIVAGFDQDPIKYGEFPVYADPLEFGGVADVLVDFSSPKALSGLLDYAMKPRKTPLVLCTTGYSQDDLKSIEESSKVVPVLRSGNMSLGINLLAELVRRACAVLGTSFDVEIVERHHRRKIDSPSGTALLLADAAASALPYEAEYVYDRQNRRQAREGNEIGISAVRGGTIIGEHEVIFAGFREVIELKHSADSRDVFAIGAIKAAKFIAKVENNGLFDMRDVLSSI